MHFQELLSTKPTEIENDLRLKNYYNVGGSKNTTFITYIRFNQIPFWFYFSRMIGTNQFDNILKYKYLFRTIWYIHKLDNDLLINSPWDD